MSLNAKLALPFSDWLISLSIILSRSINVVVKGKSSLFFFLLLNSILLCECTTAFLSTDLLKGILGLLPNLYCK